jgi:hypothetical protein
MERRDRQGTGLLLAPYHEMVQTSQQALAVCWETRHIVADDWLLVFLPLFLEKETHLKKNEKNKFYTRTSFGMSTKYLSTKNDKQ